MEGDKPMRFEDYLLEGVYDPSIFKAVFMCGGSGSGKSYVAGRTTGGHGLKLVNSDKEFEHVLKILHKEHLANMLTNTPGQTKEKDVIRKGAKKLTAKFKEGYLKGRLGLVIDGTGRHYNNITRQKAELESLGYDTYMIFVNTSLEVALERNAKRDRSLKEDFVKEAWSAVQNNMGKFQSLFGSNNFKIIDNNEYSSDDPIFNTAWKEVMKFSKKPVSNHIAKQWIKDELESRKR
jgi:cytidylate kinase